MTYWSRNSWISAGLGSSSSPSSPGSASSSSMISLQRSMHSSQMYTPGPAMSFLTCFWDLPQKEHFSSSPLSLNFAMCCGLPRGRGSGRAPRWYRRAPREGPRGRPVSSADLAAVLVPRVHDRVDQPVVERLLRVQDEVAVGVALDLLG